MSINFSKWLPLKDIIVEPLEVTLEPIKVDLEELDNLELPNLEEVPKW